MSKFPPLLIDLKGILNFIPCVAIFRFDFSTSDVCTAADIEEEEGEESVRTNVNILNLEKSIDVPLVLGISSRIFIWKIGRLWMGVRWGMMGGGREREAIKQHFRRPLPSFSVIWLLVLHRSRPQSLRAPSTSASSGVVPLQTYKKAIEKAAYSVVEIWSWFEAIIVV